MACQLSCSKKCWNSSQAYIVQGAADVYNLAFEHRASNSGHARDKLSESLACNMINCFGGCYLVSFMGDVLQAISACIPTCDPVLSPSIYEMVLYDFLQSDYAVSALAFCLSGCMPP